MGVHFRVRFDTLTTGWLHKIVVIIEKGIDMSADQGNTKPLKAFKISSRWAEGQMIVFAPTAGRAKSMALDSLIFDGCEYIELECNRCKKADQYATDQRILTMDTEKEQRIYQALGWFEFEATTCDGCGEYEFSLLPETQLDDDGYCVRCAAEGGS